MAGTSTSMHSAAHPPIRFAVERVIRAEDLPIPAAAPSQRAKNPMPSDADLNLDFAILNHVQLVLSLNRGNKLRTARQLGISRSTLYRILARKSILKP